MQLSDFFATLNLSNLSIFFLSFIIFDAAGVNIACFIKPGKYLRYVYWIFGLALFIFVWFILHFFIPFWPVYVWISLITFGVLSLPLYLKNKGPLTLFQAFIRFPYPLLIIPLIFKPFYFLVNAPPFYTDEMAYHFFSPAQLMLENHWSFWPATTAPSLYAMMPKTLDTAFLIMFSITKTYSTARLLHFLLVFSSFYTIAAYFREKIGTLPALVFTFLMPLLTVSTFLAASTWGYVDAGASILAVLFLITIADFINKPGRYRLFTAAVIGGLAISIKNTTVAFFGSVSAVSTILFLIIYYRTIRKKIFNKNLLIIISLTILFFIIFGGYWYLKNFLMTGNPIYPFVFPCWYGWSCGKARGFFQAWAMAIDKEHFFFIKNILFQNNNLLFYLTMISVMLGFFSGLIAGKRIIKYLIFIITWSVILEIIISGSVTGFDLRYYYHWFLLIPILLILPFGIFSKLKNIPKAIILIYFIYFIAVGYSVGNVIGKNMIRIYEGDFVPGYIRNYAMHRIGLNEWLDYHFPKLSGLIKWCGEKRPAQEVVVLDPALTWFSYEGMMRVFMVNCQLTGGSNKTKFIIVSETPCTKGLPYPIDDKDPAIQERHKLNQKFVCGGKEISKYLYEYNQEEKKKI
ncbi:hypothetical protein MUP32_04150 [Candidatus Microgenomates bacterium]|nr:hypothetical protein [Candidatus Microgenomates bacterium]